MRGSSARVHCAYTSRCRCGGGFWVGCDRYKCVWYVSDVREMSPRVWRRALAYRRARWGLLGGISWVKLCRWYNESPEKRVRWLGQEGRTRS